VQPLHEAIAYVTGRSEVEIQAVDDSELIRSMVVEDRWVVSLGEYVPGASAPGDVQYGGPIEIRYGPSPELMRVINIVCRLLRPNHVVETGVAKGFTTASILDAIDRNRAGHLYSVELPSLYIGYSKQVGERIPNRLRGRWTLEFGPSAVVLPRLMNRIGAVDVFVHDSAANYDNQMTEYRCALSSMPRGGVLISDMLNSDAFIETAEATECRWAVIEQTKMHPLGILSKLS
jgi:predicted O-methyltransferase YrrM